MGSPVPAHLASAAISTARVQEDGGEDAVGISSASFAFEDFRWAVATVITRQNRIPISIDSTTAAPVFGLTLIPLWDMINHADGELTSHHDPEQAATECYAMRDFKAGEQVSGRRAERQRGGVLTYMAAAVPERCLATVTHFHF